MKKKYLFWSMMTIIVITLVAIIVCFIPRKTYTNKDFGITDIVSDTDYDNDGIDDYADIYLGAVRYVETKPKYKSKYYAGGYPDDGYGVCTDVVIQAFLNAGYSIKDMIDKDIASNKQIYGIERPDSNIDFRRVVNLKTFFERTATSLSTNIDDIEEFQKGDIIVFEKHIAIISEKRNKKGIPYIIHNSGNHRYVEDALRRYKIVGHYRWSYKKKLSRGN